MAGSTTDLGDHVRTHRASGGLTGFGHKRSVMKVSWVIFGAAIGFIPGLFIALFTDFVPALLIGLVIGALAGYLLSRSRMMSTEAAVTEAQLYSRGAALTDQRGTHQISWDRVASLQGQHTKHSISGTLGVGDVEVRTTHAYALRTRDGIGYWLDDRLEDVVELANAIAQASGVSITPLP